MLFSLEVVLQNLADFVDKIVTEDLEARCTRGLMQRIWNLENSMYRAFFIMHLDQVKKTQYKLK